jgi:hypothetical protein
VFMARLLCFGDFELFLLNKLACNAADGILTPVDEANSVIWLRKAFINWHGGNEHEEVARRTKRVLTKGIYKLRTVRKPLSWEMAVSNISL